MDALYFRTDDRESLLQELGVPEDFNGIYESPDNWVLIWLGRVPKTVEQQTDEEGLTFDVVTEWQQGEYFNIYLKGQDNMDYFTQEFGVAELLSEPATPNHRLFSDGGNS